MSRPYYIFSNGRLSRKENTLYVENANEEKRAIPIEDVEVLHIFSEIDLNSKVLNFLAQHNIAVHFYNYYGFYSGSFMPKESNTSGHLTVKQVEHYLDFEKRRYIAISFVEGAIHHMRRNLREYKETEDFIDVMSMELANVYEAKLISELMGCEGRARDAYYKAFNTIFNGKIEIKKRQKHPPNNPVNALISFGNSIIYSVVLTQIYLTQLNPTISYLHEPGEKRYSLSLDIAEIFKPLIADPVIFKLVNNNMLTAGDFEQDLNFCYLTEQGKKKFLKELDQKLNTTIRHRKLRRNVSYKLLIRLECYKLIKHLIGDELYRPFKAWW
ncbi:type I-B CRISPR-associated endonuclease Cas1b [Caldisericum exile]|uniref:CRISPR-associated endonuclease Cas1 n=1 Tax=Caldisericum exile (strain DSM 21853 / NBRC 104410 / AZM16c01) TaxID=511051 RepID=A0A7U6GDH6_CALEA|nr:type I-B CRISPR-associated endonuclease Cas1b [Caldisericum exile]BAL80400.1 putative CRISPR-associated protein [Caldisericum exile AZM16c01]